MNCEQANRLLPLLVGNDLADASDAESVQTHIAACCHCAERHRRFQESLDALQSVSTASLPVGHSSLWPRLVNVLKEMPRQRDHFNGWVPAVAMALAVTLMVAVSVVQVQREMNQSEPIPWTWGSSTNAAWRGRPSDLNHKGPDEALRFPFLEPSDGRFSRGRFDRSEDRDPGFVVPPPQKNSAPHW